MKYKPKAFLQTKHPVVFQALRKKNITLTLEEKASFIWIDNQVTLERLLSLKPWQRINHFPGMNQICLKTNLARNLNKMRKKSPSYAFVPRSWCMSLDSFKPKKRKYFIAKPSCKSKGLGIHLFQKLKDLSLSVEYDTIVQEYITPYLVDGYKVDMRVYALVTNCDPLTVFVYNEGILRFATEKYQNPNIKNKNNAFMHLTNFAINKKSKKFDPKRKLSWFIEHLRQQGHDVWDKIKDIVAKSIITVNPELERNFKSCFPNTINSVCFELLGFDIMLDSKMNLYLLEINHSPSLQMETSVDLMKQDMLEEIIDMLHLDKLNPNQWRSRFKKESLFRLISQPIVSKPELELNCSSKSKNFEQILPNEEYSMFLSLAKELFTKKETKKTFIPQKLFLPPITIM